MNEKDLSWCDSTLAQYAYDWLVYNGDTSNLLSLRMINIEERTIDTILEHQLNGSHKISFPTFSTDLLKLQWLS